ncbi:MAG TPA: hypothetical protein VF712_20205 [Thermoleophilaceae bacterium]
MTRLLLATAGAALVLCLAPGAASAAECKNLKVTDQLKLDLRKAHERLTDREFSGPKGRVYHGRCGTAYYALANFKDAELGYQDQPERFTRRAGHRWKDRGDTGGPVCDTGVPRALLHRWGFSDC